MADQYYIQGKNVVLKKKVDDAYYKVACAKTVGFSFTNGIVGKTSVNDGLYIKRRVRMSDFSANFNGLMKSNNGADYVSVTHFLEEAIRRSEADYQIILTDDGGGIKVIDFNAIISDVSLNGQVGPYAEYDVNLLGNGGVNISESTGPGSSSYNILSDWWPVVAGQDYVDVGNVDSGKYAYNLTEDDVIIELARSGYQHDEVSGTPSGRELKFNAGSVRIECDPNNPFNAGETIFVLFKRPA